MVVAEPAFKYVKQFYTAEEKLTGEDGGTFYRLGTGALTGEGVRAKADLSTLRPIISGETFAFIRPQLRACVPAAIIPYLQIGCVKLQASERIYNLFVQI